MIVRFQVDVPLRERLRILWYGRVFVKADYRGQHELLRVEIGAVDSGMAEVLDAGHKTE